MKPIPITSVTLLWLIIDEHPDGNAEATACCFNQCHQTANHAKAIRATRAAGARHPHNVPASAEAFAYSFTLPAPSTTR